MPAEKPRTTVETQEDGKRIVRTAGGATMEVGTDRSVNLDLDKIEAVGIHNVADVVTHQVAEIAGSTSHYIRFHGGGELRFAYSHDGRLIELSASKISFSLSNDNELLFRRPGPKKSG